MGFKGEGSCDSIASKLGRKLSRVAFWLEHILKPAFVNL